MQFFFVFFIQLIQLKIDHIFQPIEMAIKTFATDGSFLAQIRNGDLMVGCALHETDQCIRDHLLGHLRIGVLLRYNITK